MLRAVVFDFDGVVLDTEEPEYLAWRSAWADHGLTLEVEEWAHCIGTVGVFDPMAELVARAARPVDRDAVDARRRAEHRRLVAAEVVLPGVAELLAECRAEGLGVAIASSSPRLWVEDNLRRLGLLDAFAALHCCDGAVPPKPAPDLYAQAVRALGVAPAEAVAVEDSLHGVAAAKGAGLHCVAVPGPLTAHLDLSAADARLESLAGVSVADLAALVEGAHSGNHA